MLITKEAAKQINLQTVCSNHKEQLRWLVQADQAHSDDLRERWEELSSGIQRDFACRVFEN